MARLAIEVDDGFLDWAQTEAKREGVSIDEYLELLLAMESGLKDRSRDGRQISMRTSMYRGRDPILVDDRAYSGRV